MSEEHFDRAYTVQTSDESKELYNSWARTYDADLSGGGYAQPTRVAETLSRLGVASNATILDIGCGTGLSGVALAEAGFASVDGCDYSTGMVGVASETGVYGRLFEADLHKPPIDVESRSYDAAIVVGVFGVAQVEAHALDEMLRTLRSGGTLVIGVNSHFYDSGTLSAKLEQLDAAGTIEALTEELGDHIPGRDLAGWVISMRRL